MQEYILVFIGCVMLATTGNCHIRIVGGETADIKNYPYMVSLHKRSTFLCGGSILSESFVLTAAHCLFNKGMVLNPSDMAVLAGATDIREADSWYWTVFTAMQLSGVGIFYIHDGYSNVTMLNDIALLRLTKSIDLKASLVHEVALPMAQNPSENIHVEENCTVTGWGLITPRQRLGNVPENEFGRPFKLQEVDLKVIDISICIGIYPVGMIEPHHVMCTKTPGKDTCKGDSGGPLVCNGIQEGICSWGIGCAQPNTPGVFTRVDNYLDWIQERMNVTYTGNDTYVGTGTGPYKHPGGYGGGGRRRSKAVALHVDVLAISMLVMCICCLVM